MEEGVLTRKSVQTTAHEAHLLETPGLIPLQEIIQVPVRKVQEQRPTQLREVTQTTTSDNLHLHLPALIPHHLHQVAAVDLQVAEEASAVEEVAEVVANSKL